MNPSLTETEKWQQTFIAAMVEVAELSSRATTLRTVCWQLGGEDPSSWDALLADEAEIPATPFTSAYREAEAAHQGAQVKWEALRQQGWALGLFDWIARIEGCPE